MTIVVIVAANVFYIYISSMGSQDTIIEIIGALSGWTLINMLYSWIRFSLKEPVYFSLLLYTWNDDPSIVKRCFTLYKEIVYELRRMGGGGG